MKWCVLGKTTPFHVLLKKKREKEANGAVLNGTISLLLPLHAYRTGEEEAIMFPCNATISLSFHPICPRKPTTTHAYTGPATTPQWSKSQGSHALRATPQLTLPCAMTGVRWPSPPLPINTREGGAGEKRKGESGKDFFEREKEKVKETERERWTVFFGEKKRWDQKREATGFFWKKGEEKGTESRNYKEKKNKGDIDREERFREKQIAPTWNLNSKKQKGRQRREKEVIKEAGKNRKWQRKKRKTTTAAIMLPLHRHSAPPNHRWWPRRDRGEKEKTTEKNRGEGVEKRNRGDRREGRKTSPLSLPLSTTADNHNRAFPLQVTFSPPLSFLASSSFACRTWAIHVLQQMKIN